MVSPTVYAILRVAGWSFIPGSVTKSLLRIVYLLSLRFPRLLPFVPSPPNTLAYRTQYRYTYALVVLMYLTYNLAAGALEMEYNFYELLGVTPQADEGTLKLAFRQFAKKNHPDKIARDGMSAGREEVFMMVKDAFQALKDPVVRFAYDRFGPDVLKWTDCTTAREYLHRGLMQSSGYHIVTGACLLLFSAIGRPSPVAFWRYLLFAALLTSELSILLSPSPSPAISPPQLFPSPAASFTYTTLHTIFPQRVAYQHIRILHQLFIFLSLALSQVSPQLFPNDTADGRGAVERLKTVVGIADREASIILHTELHSIHPPSASHISLTHMKPYTAPPSEQVMQLLTEEMQNMIIEVNVKKDSGPLKSIWEGAVARGRANSVDDTDDSLGLPSPVSPSGTPRQRVLPLGAPVDIDSEALAPRLRQIPGQGRLPSPRPSPSPSFPGMQRRGSSYVRARSVSY